MMERAWVAVGTVLLLASLTVPAATSNTHDRAVPQTLDALELSENHTLEIQRTTNLEVASATIEGDVSISPGATLEITSTGPIHVQGTIVADQFASATEVTQFELGGTTIYQGVDGKDAGDLILRAPQILLASGSSIATAAGQSGADVTVTSPPPQANTIVGIAGDGGSGGDLILDSEVTRVHANVRLGSGGSGGDALMDGLPGTPESLHGMNATAYGGDGAGHGNLIIQEHVATASQTMGHPLKFSQPLPGDGGDATAIGGDGYSYPWNDTSESEEDGASTQSACDGQNGIQGDSETDVGQDGTGEDASASGTKGEDGDQGCNASSAGQAGGDGGDGGKGGDAEAYGGDGGDSFCCTGGDGGDADAGGGHGGSGNLAGNGADGADGADGTTSDPDGEDGQDGGNGGIGGAGGDGGDSIAHGGDGGSGPFDDGTGGHAVAQGNDGGPGATGGSGAAGGDAGCGLPGYPDGTPGSGGLHGDGGIGGSPSFVEAIAGSGDPDGTTSTSQGSAGLSGGDGTDGPDGDNPC